tara:strand:+ start:1964 stop:2224 length:261 start_codon:yes stop_codon:yes gene_type:complete
MDKKPLYKPFKYTGNGKFKKSVYVKGTNGNPKLIHYGHSDYRHNYSAQARKSYLARAKGIKDKQGNLTYKDKNSKNYWAIKDLWKG